MNMKNTKAILFIVLGSFILATGFAFAEDSALEQLKSGPFSGASVGDLVVKGAAGSTTIIPPATPAVTPPVVPATPPAVTPPPPPKPEPVPTIGQSVMKFLGDNKTNIMLGGLGAYLGLCLIGGPAGILIGAIFLLAFGNI